MSSVDDRTVTPEIALDVLAHPELHEFRYRVWYAINAPQTLIDAKPESTLAGRLGLSASELKTLRGAMGLSTVKQTTWTKILLARRPFSKMELYFTHVGIGTTNVHFIAFSKDDSQPPYINDPRLQIAERSLVAQPSPASKTLLKVQQIRASQKRRRTPSPDLSPPPGRPPAGGAAAATASASASASTASPKASPRRASSSSTTTTTTYRSLSEILRPLGFAPPFRDSAGYTVRASLASKRFTLGYQEMSVTSGGRRELLTAASVAVHAVLSLLAPDACGTAAALAQPRQRSAAADPLRRAIATSATPTGMAFDRLVAKSKMSTALLDSYIAAEKRGEKVKVLAQILSPFTAQYSLRIFNECFEYQLGDAAPLSRYKWRYARWHAHVWLAAQTPPITFTPKHRLKGHEGLLDAIEFLTSGHHLQHVAFGVRNVKLSNGSMLTFPKTEHTQCAEALWKLFQEEKGDERHVERSTFLEIAKLVAGTEQKSYGALDTYAEHNGRVPAQELRALCNELVNLVMKLGQRDFRAGLDEVAGDAYHDRAAKTVSHAQFLSEKVGRIEAFIKSELPMHVPSCDAADPEPDVPTCPEHCRACAFGTESNDPSRVQSCGREHTMRCRECAEAHSLRADFELCLKSAKAVLEDARGRVPPPQQSPTPGPTGAGDDAPPLQIPNRDGAPCSGQCADGSACARSLHAAWLVRETPEHTAWVGVDGHNLATFDRSEWKAYPSEAAVAAASAAAPAHQGAPAEQPAQQSPPSTSQEARAHELLTELEEQFKEVSLLMQRALVKFSAFFAHERQAAHEKNVMQMLLSNLGENEAILVADWKVCSSQDMIEIDSRLTRDCGGEIALR